MFIILNHLTHSNLMVLPLLFTVATAIPDAGYEYNRPNTLGLSTGSNSIYTGAINTATAHHANLNLGFDSTYNFNTDRFGTGGQTLFAGNEKPLIHKHIYVHVAPPELELQQRQEIRSSAVAQKHYKIIFIKTLSQETSSQLQIQAQAQNQEKTLIYVLVKRPDDPQQISLNSPPPTQPSKPEVYFIKYKTASETINTDTNGAGVPSTGYFPGGSNFSNPAEIAALPPNLPPSLPSGSYFSGGNSDSGSSQISKPVAKPPTVTKSFGGGNYNGPSSSYLQPGQSGPYYY